MIDLLLIFLICIIALIIYFTTNTPKKKYIKISKYDDINENNYITNDPYFGKGIWAGGEMGPDAPTRPSMGSTPMKCSCSMYYNIDKKRYSPPIVSNDAPYLGISSYRKLYVEHPLV